MKVLELFSGTECISNKFRSRGHECFTVDWDEEFPSSWHTDISKITTKDILDRFGVPDVVWVGTDCTTYSVASIYRHRRRNEETGNLDPITEKAEFADSMNIHVKEIIKELSEINPNIIYFWENPRGAFRKMSWTQEFPRYTVTYCNYNDPLVQELIFSMEEKKCPKCGEVKPISEFYKNSSRRDGFTCYCKECISVQQKDYHKRNKEKCKERLNKWRRENAEYVRERDKKYREENPDIEFEKQRRYRETHKEALYLKGKKYREEHREYFYDKAKERREAYKKVSDGTVTEEYKEFMFYEQGGKCAYCGCDLNESGKHIDHIIPLSKGGLHTASNVHWTCPTCNLSKGNKTEEEWLKKERCKPTDIFTNHPNPKFKPPCKNGDPCHESAPRGSRSGTQRLKNPKERSMYPDELCKHIVDICEEIFE